MSEIEMCKHYNWLDKSVCARGHKAGIRCHSTCCSCPDYTPSYTAVEPWMGGEPEERARGRQKVEDKKGEAFYEHQDTIISGWELGTIAPPDLVTAEGIRGSTGKHKLKPDQENARARQLAQKAKQRKVKEMPDWIKDLM